MLGGDLSIKPMEFDLDDLPNLKFHEPVGLSFPISKRKGLRKTSLKGRSMQDHGEGGRVLRKKA